LESSNEEWRLDEFATMRNLLRMYRLCYHKLLREHQQRYVTLEQYLRFSDSVLKCLENSVDHTQLLVNSVGQLSDMMIQLAQSVIYLQNRIEQEDLSDRD
jgi:hypothetical protein